jgi:hypothetical protein
MVGREKKANAASMRKGLESHRLLDILVVHFLRHLAVAHLFVSFLRLFSTPRVRTTTGFALCIFATCTCRSIAPAAAGQS